MYFSILLGCQTEALRRVVLMLVIVVDEANDEIQMTNDEGMTKSELEKNVKDGAPWFGHWDFLRHSAFVLRH